MIKVVHIDRDEYRCICPLHNDTNPSLSINIKKNVAFCFAGCFEGTFIKFVMDLWGVSKSVAWKMIVSKEVFSFDSEYFSGNGNGYCYDFVGDVEWVPADYSKYLINRGFARSTIRFWDIEYSSEINHIRIPIKNNKGDFLCYSYRTLDKNIQPKYIHPGFRKKEGWLFGENMYEPGDCINVVEGALDCIWMWQNGSPNSIAFLGNPTVSQIKKVLEYGDFFRLCFDNDQAGKKYTDKMSRIIEKSGKKFVAIDIPEGKKDVQDLNSMEFSKIIRR